MASKSTENLSTYYMLDWMNWDGSTATGTGMGGASEASGLVEISGRGPAELQLNSVSGYASPTDYFYIPRLVIASDTL